MELSNSASPPAKPGDFLVIKEGLAGWAGEVGHVCLAFLPRMPKNSVFLQISRDSLTVKHDLQRNYSV